MTFSKNRGHGHGADKPRTRVSTDLWLTVEFDRFSLAQTLKAIFTKIHLGYEIKSIDKPNIQQENCSSERPCSDM